MVIVGALRGNRTTASESFLWHAGRSSIHHPTLQSEPETLGIPPAAPRVAEPAVPLAEFIEDIFVPWDAIGSKIPRILLSEVRVTPVNERSPSL